MLFHNTIIILLLQILIPSSDMVFETWSSLVSESEPRSDSVMLGVEATGRLIVRSSDLFTHIINKCFKFPQMIPLIDQGILADFFINIVANARIEDSLMDKKLMMSVRNSGVVSDVYGTNRYTFESVLTRAGVGLNGSPSDYGYSMTRSGTTLYVDNYGSGLTRFGESNNFISGNAGFQNGVTRNGIRNGGFNAGYGSAQNRFDNFNNRESISNNGGYGSSSGRFDNANNNVLKTIALAFGLNLTTTREYCSTQLTGIQMSIVPQRDTMLSSAQNGVSNCNPSGYWLSVIINRRSPSGYWFTVSINRRYGPWRCIKWFTVIPNRRCPSGYWFTVSINRRYGPSRCIKWFTVILNRYSNVPIVGQFSLWLPVSPNRGTRQPLAILVVGSVGTTTRTVVLFFYQCH